MDHCRQRRFVYLGIMFGRHCGLQFFDLGKSNVNLTSLLFHIIQIRLRPVLLPPIPCLFVPVIPPDSLSHL